MKTRPESPTPVKAMIKLDVTDSRRTSTSSSASSASSNKNVEPTKRPSLVRSVEAFDQDDFPVHRVNSGKKNVRITDPQSSRCQFHKHHFYMTTVQKSKIVLQLLIYGMI